MAAIDDLKTAWETEIAKISDPLIKADATYKLDSYINAQQAIADLQSDKVSSYSIGGRTFTYADVGTLQKVVQGLEDSLSDKVYGRINLVDMNIRRTGQNIS